MKVTKNMVYEISKFIKEYLVFLNIFNLPNNCKLLNDFKCV